MSKVKKGLRQVLPPAKAAEDDIELSFGEEAEDAEDAHPDSNKQVDHHLTFACYKTHAAVVRLPAFDIWVMTEGATGDQ